MDIILFGIITIPLLIVILVQQGHIRDLRQDKIRILEEKESWYLMFKLKCEQEEREQI